MKTFGVMLIGLSSICSTTITFAEQQNNQPDVYQQSYALYMLYHPETKEQNSKALVENFHQDYQPLFQKNKKVKQKIQKVLLNCNAKRNMGKILF